ncbi:GIY-YIG nuclease family protein [Gimibacter soli]|uniref:GIY-YIG nuclease family protein n=1 Tax=Gimibacter soli TaxID=3024400 RepID=A0AAF0BK61_9PROT|nr:GIY-YIG nuclease family protein [Gimibacter soli]WCL53909.1 GIY-YIG nuclease family protein [Gimibacter soli]
MFFVYILKCADGSYYTGQTDNLERRVNEHRHGTYCAYTSQRRPIELVFSEAFESRHAALSAEQQIKGWSRAKKEALIEGDFDRISKLASRKKA